MKDKPLKVYVFKFPGREHLRMQYTDPATGKKVTRTTGESNRRKAQEVAAVWQDELRNGRYQSPSKVTWADFRDRYESEVLPGLASNTDRKVCSVFNVLERLLSPNLLSSLTTERISFLQKELRNEVLRNDVDGNGKVVKVYRRSENTIAGHLAHLRAALQWGADVGLLVTMPKITKPPRSRTSGMMKGRPITTEEFERMLAKTPAVVGEAAAGSWRRFLTGLWLSGLRLSESLELYWDRDDRLCVDLSGKRPMLRIPAALEKGGRDRMLPIAPEFSEFLSRTPEAERKGPVFDPRQPDWVGRPKSHTAGRTVSKIGARAGVIVNTGSRKFASAHDLRRSFGERWASKVMPQILMVLMRHESIDTTMRFYVGRNAETTADALWEAYGRDSTNASTFGQTEPAEKTSPTVDATGNVIGGCERTRG